MKDPYEVLGLPRDAAPEAIRYAYRKLAQLHHPDKGGDEKKFKEVALAYEILSNPERRKAFDEGKLDEDGKPMRKAKDVVMHAMQDIIQQFADKEVNLVKAIRDAVAEGRAECQKNLENSRVSSRKVEKRMKALVYKGKEDSPLHMMLGQRLQALERERKMHEFGLEIAKEAEALINQYEDNGIYHEVRQPTFDEMMMQALGSRPFR